jgi:ribosomal-protein-serine acetyltransferase
MPLRFPIPIAPHAELRLLQLSHAARLFTLIQQNRRHLARHLPWVPQVNTIDDVRRFLRGILSQHRKNLGFAAGIWCHKELIGVIGLHPIDWANRNVSLGYWIASAWQGRGLVTAACRAVIGLCFSHYKLHRVEIQCSTKNPRSCAIPGRLGFRREGVLRGVQKLGDTYRDTVVYGKLESDKE